MMRLRFLAPATLAALATACGSQGMQSRHDQSPANSVLQVPPAHMGYLPDNALPDSLSLLPPPPAPGSAGQAQDDAAAKAALALSGSPRWTQATDDADLNFPHAAEIFACAVGVRIDAADTPRLYELLRRTLVDDGSATHAAKTKYQRARPFTVNAAPICTPGDAGYLRTNGSYPSGHSAVGWSWALILAEIAPERANAIFARGLAFGESRLVCNVHWLSDVAAGRLIASATVASMHSQPDFGADVAAARAEVAAARAKGLRPKRDCAKEAAQLAAQ
jgi:acid phosphatase (class A)